MVDITDQDLAMIKDYLVYYSLLLVLEYDKSKLTTAGFKFYKVFAETYEHLITEVLRDFNRHKLQMKRVKIRIKQETTSSRGICAMYECRGYHSEFIMWTDYLKAQVEEKLRSYLNRIVSEVGKA